MIYAFVLNQTMEGRVIPYLKEVRLAGNLPGQLRGMYVRCCIFTCVRAILESTPHVECTQITSLFRLATSNFTLRGQLRHQVLVHSQARHIFFAVRVVHVQWCNSNKNCEFCLGPAREHERDCKLGCELYCIS